MKAKYIEEPQTWASEFSFAVEVQVRFSETDMFGHVNNTVVFTYLEHARIEYLKSIGLMSKEGNIPVVADLQCDYVRQMYFDEKIKVHVKIAHVGSSSVDIHYMGKNEKDEIVFTARGTIVQINGKNGRPVPFTDEEKELLHGK
ncbi:acyl-CoA thioesterase [Lysinibacillus sp. 3P01SB]|uniref:acyl-CoA thioesterase n=1 Tax=Lysinibacillus sp. 3P01SB TaxID=3132284 RepID=UPI0039A6FEAD